MLRDETRRRGRLIDAIHRAAPLPAADLVHNIVTEVMGFGTSKQYDDVTLIAAVVL